MEQITRALSDYEPFVYTKESSLIRGSELSQVRPSPCESLHQFPKMENKRNLELALNTRPIYYQNSPLVPRVGHVCRTTHVSGANACPSLLGHLASVALLISPYKDPRHFLVYALSTNHLPHSYTLPSELSTHLLAFNLRLFYHAFIIQIPIFPAR